MVSFQCNACGDVCTKPKLDKHRGHCQSSFDCIDCGKRFNTPTEYKDHTTCISEAQKYQKSLYKGGRQDRNGHMGGRNDDQRSWSSRNGGEQQGRSRPAWGRTVSRATGANETPLGTPIRMSPVNDAPLSPPKISPPSAPVSTAILPVASQAQENLNKKRKSPSDETISITAGINGGELPKKKKSKTISDSTDKSKDKRSKKGGKEFKQIPPPSVPLPSPLEKPTVNSSDMAETEGPKKKKESKNKKKAESKDDEKQKKKSKSKSKQDDEGLVESAEPKLKKRKRDRAEKSIVVNGIEEKDEKKKDKSSKKQKDQVDPLGLDQPVEKKKSKRTPDDSAGKEKKSKKSKVVPSS